MNYVNRCIIKNQSGSTIIMITVLILTSILGVTLMAADIIIQGLKLGRTQVNSTKAYFAAEAGAERILWETRRENPSPLVLGDGTSDFCQATKAKFCLDGSENIFECNSGCTGTNIATTTLSNGAEYIMKFDYDGSQLDEATTTISLVGSYGDVGRAVALIYNTCDCGNWVDQGCGAGGCAANEMSKSRTCSPSACNIVSRCVADISCSPPANIILNSGKVTGTSCSSLCPTACLSVGTNATADDSTYMNEDCTTQPATCSQTMNYDADVVCDGPYTPIWGVHDTDWTYCRCAP